MSAEEPEAVEVELAELLDDFGFSEYEAFTLIGLVRLGTGTAKDVAQFGKVPRTRVYDAVETLHERGLIDIQHSKPKKFTAVSRESIVRKLNTERENLITDIDESLEQLGPIERQREQRGVWTVTGRAAVADRVFAFMDDSDEQIVYVTVDDLLTDDHLAHLRDADERGVSIYLAGISEEVQSRIQDTVPSAELFETLWAWEDTPAGSLLVTDEQSALVSVRVNGSGSGGPEESAIWGYGDRNCLAVVLRSIFTWRLRNHDTVSSADS